MKTYKHIFFDLDQTLWDFETNSHQTLTELAHKYKLSEKGISSVNNFIQEYVSINERMWDEYRQGTIDKTTLRYGRFQQTLNKFNITDIQLSENLANDYIAISPLKTTLFPHTKEVLQYLNKKYTLHIITNGFEEVQHIKIKNCGIASYFSQIITSEQAGFKKPDSRMFQYSLDVTNAQPTNSIMIGDNLDADIIGARNASIDQVYFNPKKNKHEEKTTYEIKSLKELTLFL